MIAVSIVDTQSAVVVDRRLVRRLVRSALRGEPVPERGAVAVVITGDREISALCERHMGRPRRTDVLAFPGEGPGSGVRGPGKRRDERPTSNIEHRTLNEEKRETEEHRLAATRETRSAERERGGVCNTQHAARHESDSAICNPHSACPEAPYIGDVIVNAQRAVREARRRGIDPAHELSLYFVHGVLHLVGYDDQDSVSARRMHEQEEAVLARFGIASVYRAPVLRRKNKVSGEP